MADNPYMKLADQEITSGIPPIVEAPTSNPYMDLANSDLKDAQERIRGVLDIVSPINPDQAAESAKLSRSTGLSEQTVLDNLAEVKRRERVRALDLQRMMTESPVLARQLTDGRFASIAQDNVEQMSELEKITSFLGRSAGSGPLNLAAAAVKLVEAINPFTTSEEDLAVLFKNDPEKLKDMRENGASAALSRWAQSLQKQAQSIMDNAPEEVKQQYNNLEYFTTDTDKAAYLSPIKMIGDAVQSLPTTLALMASMYFTKGAAGQTYASMIEAGASREVALKEATRVAAEAMAKYSAASEGAVGYAQQANQTRAQADKVTDEQLRSNPNYLELVDKEGFSPEAARIYLSAKSAEQAGTLAGLVDAVTNFYGGRFLGRYITEGGKVLPRMGKGFATEALTEAPQSMGEQLAGNYAINENMNRDQSLTEGVAEAGAAGFFVGGLTGGGFSAMMGGVEHRDQQASSANTVFDLLNRINDLAGADVVRQRDVQTFANFMQSVQDEHGGDINTLYISPQTLIDTLTAAGANIQQVIAEVPSLANLPEQAQNGTDVAIPVADFATHIAGSDYAQALLPHLKADPTGMSKVEADEYMQSHGEQLKAEVEKVLAQQENKDDFKASMDKVKADIKTQLADTKRFRDEVNDAYATLMATFYATTGAKIGLTPEEMAAKYPVKIKAEGVATSTEYDQNGALITDSANFKSWFKQSKAVDEHGKPLVAYHQTTINAAQSIAKEGFRTDKPRARSSDEQVPDGIFFKPHTRSIGVGSANKDEVTQIPVYLSMQNPLVVKDRSAITNAVNDEEYTRLAAAYTALDKKLAAEFDEKWNDKAFAESDAWDTFSDDWESRVNTELPAAASAARERLTAVLKERGYDGMIIEEDAGAFNRSTKTYIVFDSTQAKSIENSGEFNGQNPDIYNQFAGQRAANANLESLAKAKQMLADKRSPETVRRETGWFMGADRLWRFEISDEDAKFNDSAVVKPEDIREELRSNTTFKPSDSVPNLIDATYDKGGPNQITAFGYGEEAALDNLAWHVAKRRSANAFQIDKVNSGDKFDLSSVLAHPRLYEAYPDLAGITVRFVKTDEYRGSYSPSSDVITISLKEDQEQMLSTLLHEVQHAIQERENFARGGMPDETFVELIKAKLDDLKNQSTKDIEQWKWANELKIKNHAEAARVARYGLAYESAQRLIDYSNRDKPSGVFRLIRNEMQWIYHEPFANTEAANQLQRDFYAIPKPHKMRERNAFISDMAFRAARMLLDEIPANYREQFKNDTRTLKGMIKALQRESDKARKELADLNELESASRRASKVAAAHQYSSPYTVYRALAGEVEARNTQTRQKMSEQERKDKSPAQTADVEAENIVVMFGGLDIQAPHVAFQEGGTYNQGQDTARGSFNPETATITLLKAANLSTFLHESGHFFLEVNADIASRPDAPVEIVQDMQKILDWFGVEDLSTWRGMDIEAKRHYHEQFARGFEAYLFEGTAPSVELQGVFQRFRSWLVSIYKQIANLNVTLDDEIRGVFDRMLASSEAIVEAEQARSFAPLFTSKPPFMTDEEWLAYQQTDMQSAQDAVQELETKSLKDMKWLSNAKSRLLKAMQKENAELRKEVRREVQGEVMAEPVYRAREFFKRGTLDGEAVETPVKLSIEALEATYGEQKGEKVKKQKQSNGFMDFLVKFGINISDKGNVGADSKGKYRVGLFVKQGTSLDVLAQHAVEYGYLTQADIDSDTDNGGVNKLTDMIQRALSGERILTMEEQVQENINRYDAEAEQDADIPDIGAQSNVGTKDAMRELGFSEDEIKSMLANQFWKKLGFGKYGMLANGENTITPDQAAELFGYSSGDHLVRELANAPDPRTVIEERTDQRMMERYGDINSPQTLSRAADEAIHNDARARFVATEANALAKAVGKPRVVANAAKQYAQQIINRLKIRNIRAGQYAASAARAGREAAKSKDLIEQATAKRNQLINTYAAKAAYAAQDEVIRGVRYLTKFDGKNIAKTVHIDSLEQIWALLDRFDLRKSTSLKELDRRRSLLQWVDFQREKGQEPVVPQELLDEAYRISYKEMTLEDFRGLIDTVQNIEHLGRLKSKLIKIQDQREFKAIAGEASDVIRENATGSIDDQLEQKGLKNAVVSNGREVLAWHRKFASLIRQMDGFKDGGFLWSTFVKPMNEAGTQEASMREQATVKLAELYKMLGKVDMNKKTFIPEIGASLTMEGRLAIALNMGNETNMRRVMEGEGWNPAQVSAIVGSLTREQWNFVQGVWDFINSYWPEIAAKERRLTGIVPEKVEARSFVVTLQDGTQMDMAGGYYPIKYNAARSSKAEADSAADVLKQMERGLYARAQTARGHLEARAESVGRPMRYDLGVIDQHLNQVIHDLSWHEYLIDANRLLNAESIDSAIREHYGPEVLKVMKKTMEDIAIGEIPSQGTIERGVRYIRSGVSIAAMGWNLATAFLQPLGLTQSMVRIGPKWVAKGMGRWLRDASSMESTVQWVGEKSEFMRLRAKTMQREISEIRNTINKGETMSAVEGSFFYLIGKLQLVADIPTWVGMYEKAMAEGNNEDRAIALADQAVLDSQGGGQIKDLSMVQRGGEWQKLWTNFYSFFNVTYNQLAESIGETKKAGPSRLPLLAADFLMLTVVPATLGFFLKAALKGNLGDDDEDKLIKKLAAENISYLFGMMIGLREMNAAVSGSMGYEGPAGARFFADVAKFAKQVNQGEADEAFWRSVNELGGVLLHYPALQIDRTVRGMIELSDKDSASPLAPLFGPKPKN